MPQEKSREELTSKWVFLCREVLCSLTVAPASRIDVEKVNALCDLLLTRKDVKTVMVSDVGSTLWETLMRTAGTVHTAQYTLAAAALASRG